MRFLFLSFSLLLSAAGGGLAATPSRAAPEPASSVTATVQAEQGEYKVRVDQERKSVEVTRQDARSGRAPHLRLRLLRRADPPLEVGLSLLEKDSGFPRYAGEASMWSGSVVGFQLEFSFDRKTWKRLGRKVSHVFP